MLEDFERKIARELDTALPEEEQRGVLADASWTSRIKQEFATWDIETVSEYEPKTAATRTPVNGCSIWCGWRKKQIRSALPACRSSCKLRGADI